MKCSACGRDYSVMKHQCPHCGGSATPLLDNQAGARHLSAGSTSAAAGDGPLVRRLDKGQPPNQEPLAQTTDWLDAPLDMEIFQVSNFVFYSPHVQNNLIYRDRAATVNLVYAYPVDAVNAFATDARHPDIDADPPMIVIFEGLVRATRLAAIGLAHDRQQKTPQARRKLIDLFQQLGGAIIEGGGRLPLDAMETLAERAGLAAAFSSGEIKSRAHSYRAAMIMGVISHELGHIALAHTLGAPLNHVISRNQEREADSFAASVISSSPFSDYLATGIIFFWLILTWADAAATEHEHGHGHGSSTHPHARQRLLDFIRNNREQAESIGITEETILEFMPAA